MSDVASDVTAGPVGRARFPRPWNTAGRKFDWLSNVLLAIPVAMILIAGWAHRWTTDDGFINVRIVQQIFAGHGPVFNAGERVEVGTSPLWLLLLTVGHFLFVWVPIEWVAVVLGLLAGATAVILAQGSAIRTYRTRRVIPFGMLAFVALPPVWDFTTAGLETALSWCWIACAQVALTSAISRKHKRSLPIAAATIGLGPLVRPDLLVMSVVFGVAFVALSWSLGLRSRIRVAAAMLALPSLYELFRAAYYAELVPNTAFTKEATLTNWKQGWLYLRDFVGPYWLWVGAVPVLMMLLLLLRDAPPRTRLVMVTPVLAGLTHGFFVVRGGGDHMHARLLLPALFAILLPIAAVPRRKLSSVAVGLLVLWCSIPLLSGGPPYVRVGPDRIANERTVWIARSASHRVTLADYRKEPSTSILVSLGMRAAQLAAREFAHARDRDAAGRPDFHRAVEALRSAPGGCDRWSHRHVQRRRRTERVRRRSSQSRRPDRSTVPFARERSSRPREARSSGVVHCALQ